MTIGKRIFSLRKKSGMSQEELAEAVEVSKQSVSKWELEKAYPNIEKLVKLCEVFDVTADYILTGESSVCENKQDDGGDTNTAEVPRKQGSEALEVATSENNFNTISDKGVVNIIGIIVGIVLILISGIYTYKIAVQNNFAIKDDHQQQYAYVESIYNQYTSANVVYMGDNGEVIEKTVFLDLNGVNEGDFIFCYVGSDEEDEFRFKYKDSTVFGVIICFLISICIFIFFLVKTFRRKKHEKKHIGN